MIMIMIMIMIIVILSSVGIFPREIKKIKKMTC